jgi:hypothetical protein
MQAAYSDEAARAAAIIKVYAQETVSAQRGCVFALSFPAHHVMRAAQEADVAVVNRQSRRRAAVSGLI